ncbi:MAG: glycosyltransferase [Verrucomicrobiota bacterium]|nr:glycosyltransferase [Verrucomicrobiota bacterium]
MTPTLSIILPTYNEAGNILTLLAELERHVVVPCLDIIVVDDDSPDLTWQIALEYAKTHPAVRVLRRTEDRGLVKAINAGLAAAKAPLVLWMDADLSMPPDRIPALLAAIDAGADVAVGSRYVEGGGDARSVSTHLSVQKLLSKVLSTLGSLMLGCQFRDWSSGFIVLRRELLDGYTLRGDYGEYFIDLIFHLVRKRGARIVEVPYTLTPRIHGESKTATNLWGFVRRGRHYLSTLWRVRFGASTQ